MIGAPSAGAVAGIAPSPLTSGHLAEIPCSSSVRCRFGNGLGGASRGRELGRAVGAYIGTPVRAALRSASAQYSLSLSADVEQPGGTSGSATTTEVSQPATESPQFIGPGWFGAIG